MAYSMDFHYRLSDDDYANLKAKAAGLSITCSDYLRLATSLPLEIYNNGSSPILLDSKTLLNLYRELNRWGTNYNQGVRALNTIALLLKKTNLTEKQQREIASYAVQAERTLRESKEGILDTRAELERLISRHSIEVPARLMLKLQSN